MKDKSPAGWKVADGVLTVVKSAGNIETKRSFKNYQLHLEWHIPTEITGSDQARAAPTITGSVSPNPVAYNGKAAATAVASDALSGPRGASECAAVNTSLAGSFTVTCSATDKAGNTATVDVPYSVDPLPFSGFQSPINSDPSAWNSAKGVSAVEL